MTFNMTDVIMARDAAEGAAAILNAMLCFFTNRLTSMVTVQSIIIARLEQKNGGDLVYDSTFIKNAIENPEDLLRGIFSIYLKWFSS